MRGKPGSFLAMLARRLTKIEIHGQENLAVLERPGPAMIVVNHTTVVDVVVVVGTLHKLGFTVDRKFIKLNNIKQVGVYDAEVRLHREVKAILTLEVVAA